MVATARTIKQKHPNARVVFIGPCAAKKLEASRRTVRSDVDFVITFEELQAMFDAKKIVPVRMRWQSLPSTMRLEQAVDMRWQAVWQKPLKNVLTNTIRMCKYTSSMPKDLQNVRRH